MTNPRSVGDVLAGQWAVIDTGWDFLPTQVDKITAKQVRWTQSKRQRQASIAAVMGIGSETDMRLLAARLTSAKAEMNRREQAARVWFEAEKQRLRTAATLSRQKEETMGDGA